jgi:glycosyltransferase involved in cell wall biosynthesis
MKIAAIFRSIEFLGGAEKVFLNTTKLLREKGHTVDIYILGSVNANLSNILGHFINQELIHPPKPFNKSIIKAFINYYNPIPHKNLAEIINRNKYDIVYICHLANVIRLLGRFNTTTVCYVHEPLSRKIINIERPIFKKFNDKIFRLLTSSVDKASMKKANFLFANSKYTQDCIYNEYGLDSKILYPSIDVEMFVPSQSNIRNKIFIPGRIEPLKNQMLALEAIGYIDFNHKKDFEILLEDTRTQTSFPYYISRIEHKVKQLEESGWKFIRFKSVSEDILIKYYQKSVVTLYPPRFEPFGMIALESMACGTPIISLNEGGPKESIKHKETGFLSENKIKQYTKYISYVLDNPDEARKMGINGRKRIVENFTHAEFFDRLDKSLRELK